MVRITKQKRILYEEIKKFKSFFNAYDIHSKINNKISLATTYRFLNTLENQRLIHSFICDNKKIYSNQKTGHTHFKCEKCRKVNHINLKNVDFLKDFIKNDICHFQIELVGICSECK